MLRSRHALIHRRVRTPRWDYVVASGDRGPFDEASRATARDTPVAPIPRKIVQHRAEVRPSSRRSRLLHSEQTRPDEPLQTDHEPEPRPDCRRAQPDAKDVEVVQRPRHCERPRRSSVRLPLPPAARTSIRRGSPLVVGRDGACTAGAPARAATRRQKLKNAARRHRGAVPEDAQANSTTARDTHDTTVLLIESATRLRGGRHTEDRGDRGETNPPTSSPSQRSEGSQGHSPSPYETWTELKRPKPSHLITRRGSRKSDIARIPLHSHAPCVLPSGVRPHRPKRIFSIKRFDQASAGKPAARAHRCIAQCALAEPPVESRDSQRTLPPRLSSAFASIPGHDPF